MGAAQVEGRVGEAAGVLACGEWEEEEEGEAGVHGGRVEAGTGKWQSGGVAKWQRGEKREVVEWRSGRVVGWLGFRGRV